MNKKPLMKDAESYFLNPHNWEPLWYDDSTGLRIEKLRNVSCMRLCLECHEINEYVYKPLDTLVYFVGAKRSTDIKHFMDRTSLTQNEIKDLFRYHWEEEQ